VGWDRPCSPRHPRLESAQPDTTGRDHGDAGSAFLDLAHCLTLVDLVVLGDSLVRRKRCTPDELVALAEKHRGPHSRLARRAARLVRAGVDSPMETRLRLLIVLAGLPEPEVDHRAHDDDGTLLRRYDLSYLPFRLIIEYDGRQHAESDEQWLSDIGRDEALDDERIRRLVVVARDIYSTPANTLARIPRALRRAGVPVPRTGTSGADTSRAGRATSRSRRDPTSATRATRV